MLSPFLLTLLVEPLAARARAGGAGGGSFSGGSSGGYGGGGGGGDGIGVIIDLIVFLLRAGPVGWLILLAIAGAAYFFLHARNGFTIRATEGSNPYNSVPAPAVDVFGQAFPGEPGAAFTAKVNLAFLTIQRAWSDQDPAPMRRFLSDGVYQRFHAQFTMMKLLEQTNRISNVRVEQVRVVKAERDGAYDCVDVLIQARANDQFVCRRFPQLNSPGGDEAFTEFWTFLRRADARRDRDIYHSEACPQCGAPLTDKLQETARCPYCGVYLNQGEFDWVLAEITQPEDYGIALPLPAPMDRGAAAVRALDPGFSVHQLEDKAANAFMEVLIGVASGQAPLVKRFTTEAAFAELSRSWPKSKLAYDRLFTRTVEFLRAEVQGTHAKAYVGIRYACHLVDLAHPQAPAPGTEGLSTVTILALARDYAGAQARGSVYAGSCPHCGAPQRDNLSPVCDHCGAQLNDAALDWVVEAVLDPGQYRALGTAASHG